MHACRSTLEDPTDGSRQYDYDRENRLVWASGTPTTALVYDPLGRLFQVTHGGVSTQFLYDGDALVAEYNDAGALVRRYVHGTGTDVPLVEYHGEGTTTADRRNLLPNHQGSIIAVTNNDGARLAINAYDNWGIPNPGNIGRFQYTGQIWLGEIGLYHYKARIYSPTLGRFLQTDPIGYEDQMNLYAYVGNDPVNMIDPSGTFRDVYIGGGGDSLSGIVGNYAEEQRRLHPNRDIRYFSYSDVGGIAAALREPLRPGEPLNVIGHSWGGDRALEKVSHSGNQVTNLFTIDPVGMQDPHLADSIARNTDNWINVMATPADENRNWGDTVASVGRWFGSVPPEILARADRTIPSTQNHGNFRSMMDEANALRIIDRSYRSFELGR